MNRDIIDPMIKKSTETLTAWTEQRGSFKEYVFRKEDFAELIVRECMKLAEEQGLQSFSHQLQFHFGVDRYD